MKPSLLLSIILLSCVMLDTTYSQNLIDRINIEQHLGYSYFMGEKKDEKNAYKKAIVHYEKSIKDMQVLSDDVIIENSLEGAYLNLGVLYFTQGNHKKTLECKRKYYNYHPDGINHGAENDLMIENLYVYNAENGWKPIENGIPNVSMTDNEGSMYFYNVKKLNKRNGIIKVWIKRDETGFDAPPEANDYEVYKKAMEKSEKGLNEILKVRFPYVITLNEFNCNSQKSRILQIVSYDENGSVINSSDYNNAEWNDIVPGSMGEGILEFFCK